MKLYRVNYMHLSQTDEDLEIEEVEVLKEDKQNYYVLTFSPNYPVKVDKTNMTSKQDFYKYFKNRENLIKYVQDSCIKNINCIDDRINVINSQIKQHYSSIEDLTLQKKYYKDIYDKFSINTEDDTNN